MDELIDRKKLSAVMTEVGLDMTRGPDPPLLLPSISSP